METFCDQILRTHHFQIFFLQRSAKAILPRDLASRWRVAVVPRLLLAFIGHSLLLSTGRTVGVLSDSTRKLKVWVVYRLYLGGLLVVSWWFLDGLSVVSCRRHDGVLLFVSVYLPIS